MKKKSRNSQVVRAVPHRQRHPQERRGQVLYRSSRPLVAFENETLKPKLELTLKP